jgi:HlyD family secretion protein
MMHATSAPDDRTSPRQPTEASQAEPPPSKRLFLVVLLIAGGVLGVGTYGHWRTDAAAAVTQRETIDFEPSVRTTIAKALDTPMEITLPGQTDAFDRANIYPRATGYIGKRLVDIGSRIKQGDLLVHIAAPDLDRQLDQATAQLKQTQATLRQAQAQVGQAQANLKLGNATFARADAMSQRGYDTMQNRDNQEANVATQQANLTAAQAGVTVAEANIEAQQATVNRLQTLAAFEDVTAPFDGVITARNIDVGDLVNADAGAAAPMFVIARDDVLRVTVHVPQSAATGMRDGLGAKVSVLEMPDHVFDGKVARSSGALASSSRTLTVEVDIDNAAHLLRAGLFVNVSIAVPRQRRNVVLPSEALIFDQNGLQVAVIGPDLDVHLQPIKVYRDFGASVELSEGLHGGEEIALNPPTTLQEGAKVRLTPSQDDVQAAK